MRKYLPWGLFTFSSLANAISITETPSATQVRRAEFAVIPTTAGQIGVNPVDNLGPSSTYRGSVAPTDTALITASAGTTRWLHKHIEYLTEETSAGSTKTVQVVIATATAAAHGQSVGDISIVLAEGLAQSLKDSAAAAVEACGITNLRRRDLVSRQDASSAFSCLARAAQQASSSGLYHGIEDATWDSLNIDLASSATEDLVAAFQIFKTQARLKKQAILYFAAAVIALGGAELVGKINIPAVGFGAATTEGDNDKCKGLPKLGQESPLCADKECLGEVGGLCTVGAEKDCPCLGVMQDPDPYFWDGVNEMLDQAAKLLPSIAAMDEGPATMSQASATTINAPTPTPECKDDKIATSQDFTIKIPSDKNAITVELPIANPAGDWAVNFDKSDSIAFWQIDAGATKFVPITNGNGAPPDGKITWKVPDGNPTTNTKMTLQFTDGNLELKATITGSSSCKVRGQPSKNPTCQANTVPGYILLQHLKTETKSQTPKEILYTMRETICNNKCENPPDIPTKSVFATPDGDGCEIAIAVSGNIEAWAYRGTQAKDAQQQDCWDSLENIIEKCTDNLKPATGWVNGPDDYEFFQTGFRGINGDGSKHSKFEGDYALQQDCPDPKPSCDTCFGGANNNVCSQGENNGCACEPVSFTQPPPPKVTNCATAVVAAEIACCNRGPGEYKNCGNEISGCGVVPNLEAACQYTISTSSTYQTCGQFDEDGPIVRGSHMDDVATCLNGKFALNAEFKYF